MKTVIDTLYCLNRFPETSRVWFHHLVSKLLDGLVVPITGTQAIPRFAWHDDVIKWKHFPRDWRSPVNSPRKGQGRGALMFYLICVWINGWINNHEAGDLKHYRAHHDVTVMGSSPVVLAGNICQMQPFSRWQHSFHLKAALPLTKMFATTPCHRSYCLWHFRYCEMETSLLTNWDHMQYIQCYQNDGENIAKFGRDNYCCYKIADQNNDEHISRILCQSETLLLTEISVTSIDKLLLPHRQRNVISHPCTAVVDVMAHIHPYKTMCVVIYACHIVS